jgi:large subunit ribosomal protein L10e
MGNTKREDFPVTLGIVAESGGQIRHSALEAARIVSNAFMTKNADLKNFRIRINVKPHHVLRENKMMAFAGADRLQAGMRHSFGKPAGTAARVRIGQVILLIKAEVPLVAKAKEALRRANMKFPIKARVKLLDGPEEIRRKFGQ